VYTLRSGLAQGIPTPIACSRTTASNSAAEGMMVDEWFGSSAASKREVTLRY
jgi:hypothetical protein